MGFGGPVWHASIGIQRGQYSFAVLRQFAVEALRDVGNADAGEWEEVGGAFHLRRRLTEDEQQQGVGAVCDVRGTEEATRRFQAMRHFIPERLGITEPF